MTTANSYRKLQRPTAEITLPSGAVFTLRRPQLQVWMAAGKLPQGFMKWIEAVKANPAAEVSETDLAEGMHFLRDAIIDCCVLPGVVAEDVVPDDETQIRFSELYEEDFTFLSKWIVAGAPGVPVPTKGGEVAHDDLAKFRQKRPGGGFVDAGDHGPEVREEAIEAFGAA